MTSVVEDPLPPSSDDENNNAPFPDEFVQEIRGLLAPRRSGGLFGDRPAAEPADTAEPEPVDDADDPVHGTIFLARTPETRADAPATSDAADDPAEGTVFLARTPDAPADEPDERPGIQLFLPRTESVDVPRPTLRGLALPTTDDEKQAPVPNLFVSSSVAPAEVAFVPAEEAGPDRRRWVLIVVGLLAVALAVWLTWLAQSSETVDAPVTTVDLPSTTEAVTTASTTASTAATTTVATTSTTVVTTEATTVTTAETTAATPAPTTPRRPATTARPRTTAPPTTAAPTTDEVTIPELSTTVVPTWMTTLPPETQPEPEPEPAPSTTSQSLTTATEPPAPTQPSVPDPPAEDPPPVDG